MHRLKCAALARLRKELVWGPISYIVSHATLARLRHLRLGDHGRGALWETIACVPLGDNRMHRLPRHLGQTAPVTLGTLMVRGPAIPDHRGK